LLRRVIELAGQVKRGLKPNRQVDQLDGRLLKNLTLPVVEFLIEVQDLNLPALKGGDS
jgi:hypothetical protein